jgi:CubicO group peptidase (beta-lactamase class C family)
MLKRVSLVGLGSLVIALSVGGLLYKKELTQLYHVIHLFDADVIVHNFSNIDTMIDTIRLTAVPPIHTFGRAPQPIPTGFEFKGKNYELNDWLVDSSTTALVVLKGNDITYEGYYQGTTEWDARISWSMAKSFLSALFGVAVADGDVASLEQAVTDYVPELVGTGYDGVRIKDVLQMSSGVHFNEDYGDFNSDINRFGRILALGGSFDDFAATLERGREPGNYMHYVSIDTHVIGMVLRAATGRDVVDYFNDKLWSKLGAERDAYYIIDTEKQPMVLGGLNMISRDYARFGLLYRDNGRLNGEQIIPEQWITDSLTPDAPHLMPGPRDSSDTSFGYGYQWWIPENSDGEFMAIGIYGQYIYINRPKDVVIVKNSADREFMDNNYESDYEVVAAFRAIADSLE